MQANGTIYVDIKVETSGFEAGRKEIEAIARRIAKTVSGIGSAAEAAVRRQVNAFVKQNQAYAAQEQKVDDLRAKLDEMRDQEVETKEYSNLSREIEKTEVALEKLSKRREKFLSTKGTDTVITSEYKAASREVDRLEKSLDKLIEKRNKWDMEGAPSGQAYEDLENDIQILIEKIEAAKIKKEDLEITPLKKVPSLRNWITKLRI